MKTLPIRPQSRLSLNQTLLITLNGIRYRLFRSSVTVTVVCVAIAFMMNILSEGVIKRSVARATRERIAQMRMVSLWSGRLSMVPSKEEIVLMLAAARPNDRTYEQLQRMSGLTGEAMTEARKLAREAEPYLRFSERLDVARRRVLLGGAEGTEVFDRLTHPRHMERFLSGLAEVRTVRLPTPQSDLTDFVLQQWPVLRQYVDAMRAGWSAGVTSLRRQLDGRMLVHALREADGSFGQVIRDAGFVLSDSVARVLTVQARRASDRRRIEGTLSHLSVRQLVAAQLDVLPGQVNLRRFWDFVGSDAETANAFLRTARADGADLSGIDAQRVLDISRLRTVESRLDRADRVGGDAGEGLLGMGERTAWLVLISVVVCIVGIANVMLISVAERFREIATLKCLGALDEFIMSSFVLEAGLLGGVGGVVGALFGALIAMGRMSFVFGRLVFSSFPAVDMLLATLFSIVLGIVLATIAAVYPSFRAARLPPMEAMRIE